MGRDADLIGRRFGKLTVVERMSERQDRYLLWRCRCDCGGEIQVNTKRLTRGTVTNCGCIPKQTARSGFRPEDLTGKTFGRLTVLRRAENRNGRVCWLCRCECGALHTAAAHELKAGKVTSCGCGRKSERACMVDLTGERFGRLTALYATPRRDSKGSVYWHCRCDCGSELDVTEDSLVHGSYRSCGCRKRELQREIAGRLHRIDDTCVEWLEKRKHRSDNTSGFRGVYPTRAGGYKVMIGFKKQRFYVGSFRTFPAAVDARLEAEQTIHDGFVRAYYLWREQTDSVPESEKIPFHYDVKKVDGTFSVTTNVHAAADPQNLGKTESD